MEKIFKQALFNHRMFVNEKAADRELAFDTVYALAGLFNIRIVAGEELAEPQMIRFASGCLGENVPKPFYRGFPETVRQMAPDELLFDQLLSYFLTYGINDFDEPRHSVLESELGRAMFKENAPVRDFVIVPLDEAEKKLSGIIEDLLAGSRPLSDEQYKLVSTYFTLYPDIPEHCASKNTAVRLLLDLRDLRFAKFLMLSDVIKLLDEINYRSYNNTDLKKLNLKNRDRKFLTAVINEIILAGHCDSRICCEKKDIWCGLLHHLHYKPVDQKAKEFTDLMRGRKNISVWSEFEAAMAEHDVVTAVLLLKKKKGSGAVYRNIDYLFSRCPAREQELLFSLLPDDNPLLLTQLLFNYSKDIKPGPRTFKFTRYEKLRVHAETSAETARRKTYLPAASRKKLADVFRKKLSAALSGRLGKVYIDPVLQGVAIPIQETTSLGGFGSLPRGSRLPIPVSKGKKLRGFTYWEKVNDIDLSVMGLDDDGYQIEYSWRTLARMQSDMITFSGDVTSGYKGGSEYFDVDLEKFRVGYPRIHYLIFCDNVFTGVNFSKCFCRAGYMLRDINDSGEIYEPKTVQSAFTIDCESTFAYLFAVDLRTNEMVWMNAARESFSRVAGLNDNSFLLEYLEAAKILSFGDILRMGASELAEDPKQADIVFSDETLELPEGVEQIHSYDIERMIAMLNCGDAPRTNE